MLPDTLNKQAYQNMRKAAERQRQNDDEKWFRAQPKKFKDAALKRYYKCVDRDLETKTDWQQKNPGEEYVYDMSEFPLF